MRKIYKLLIALSILIGSVSCESFLDRDPEGWMSEDDYFKTPNAGYKSVVKCYQTLKSAYGYEWARAEIGNIATDESEKGGSDAGDRPFVADLAYGRATSANTSLTECWSVLYMGIANCNDALANITTKELTGDGGMPLPQEIRDRYIAEVRVLRAFYYYELVKIFGGVPLIEKTLTVEDAKKLVRVSETEIYNFIAREFSDSNVEKALPAKSALSSSELGRITKEVLWSMQTKLYMFFAKDDDTLYALAKASAEKVVTSPSHGLDPDFQKLFVAGNYRSKESIFMTICGDDAGSFIYGSFIPVYSAPRNVGGYGFDQPTQSLVDEFEEGDPRLLFTVVQSGDKFQGNGKVETLNFSSYPNTGYHSRKAFLIAARRGPGWGDDAWTHHTIRYADILLLYAEAVLKTGGDKTIVVGCINDVRRRANNSRHDDAEAVSRALIVPNKNIPMVSAADDLEAAIKHERRVEFAMECNRFYDLKRWNEYVEAMNNFSQHPAANGRGAGFTKGKNEVFPIPQSEIDRTGGSIKQNPGYN